MADYELRTLFHTTEDHQIYAQATARAGSYVRWFVSCSCGKRKPLPIRWDAVQLWADRHWLKVGA